MRSPSQLLLALALLAAPPRAAPQAPAFSTTPLLVRTPVNSSISLAPFSVPWTVAAPPPYPSNDLFVSLGQVVHRHPWRSIALPGPLGFGSPAFASCAEAGLFDENGGDGLADLAFCYFTASPFQQGALVYFGDNPAVGFFPATQPNQNASSLATAHLINARRDVLVAFDSVDPGFPLAALDFGGGGVSPALAASFSLPSTGTPGGDDQPLPIRLSPAAQGSARVHDLARSLSPGLEVLWNLGPSATLSAGGFQLVNVPLAQEVRGAAALDVDFDGIPDLVACLFSPAGTQPGKLVWVKNDDVPADLTAAAASPGDLGALLGVADARLCRPLDLDGTPALAVWDAAPSEIVVATSDAAGRRLLVWRGATGGKIPFDIRAGDVVGSPLADLVVAYRDVGEVDVFPDAGDALPDLAWESPPPASAVRGQDLALSVVASDADGRVVGVEWFLGGAGTSSATENAPPYSFAIAGPTLCGAPGPLEVLVRATDDVGLYRELEAVIPLVDGPPLLSVAGARDGAVTVPLAPGGTRVALDVAVTGGCGVSVDWTAPAGLVAAGATPGRQDGARTVRFFLDVPEAAYPAILALPSLSFAAEVRATSSPGGTASLPVRIDLDPEDLVGVVQSADRAELAQGELALLTTTLRSAVSVDLPVVLVAEALEGLEAAGPVSVLGARALAAAQTATGLAVTLDALPGGGTPVVLEVPVRRTLATAGSASARAVAPASGAALSREASIGPGRATLPGCGCGSAGGGAPGILLLLLYVKAMRRVPARTRSTSSRTPMRRQA